MKLSEPQIEAIGSGLAAALLAGLDRSWPALIVNLVGAAGIIAGPQFLFEVEYRVKHAIIEFLKQNPPEITPDGLIRVEGSQGWGDGPAYDPVKGSA